MRAPALDVAPASPKKSRFRALFATIHSLRLIAQLFLCRSCGSHEFGCSHHHVGKLPAGSLLNRARQDVFAAGFIPRARRCAIQAAVSVWPC